MTTVATKYKQFRRAMELVQVAKAKAYKAMVAAFPVGSQVSYEHGRHTRYGEVIMYRFPPFCDLKIRSERGAEIWVDAWRIEGAHQ